MSIATARGVAGRDLVTITEIRVLTTSSVENSQGTVCKTRVHDELGELLP